MRIELVAIAKNEARYLKEWLAYHLWLGVDRITVFNNESTDETGDILERASKAFPVYTAIWPTPENKSPQLTAYNHYLAENRHNGTLTGFIDLDEFVVGRTPANPLDGLRELSKDSDVGAICINQRVFGDSGLCEYTDEPVIKRLTHCSRMDYKENHWVKSFYRLPYVEQISVHSSPLRQGRHVLPNGRTVVFEGEPAYSFSRELDFATVQVSHYVTKTIEEFRFKQQRGGGAAATQAERLARYNDDFFFGRQTHINDTKCGHSGILAEKIDAIIADFEAKL